MTRAGEMAQLVAEGAVCVVVTLASVAVVFGLSYAMMSLWLMVGSQLGIWP